MNPDDAGRTPEAMACRACGALIYAKLPSPRQCPFCKKKKGFRIIRLELPLPEGMIPFEISREDAAKRFSAYLKEQPEVSDGLMKLAEPENFQPVYIPFWRFTFRAEAKYSAAEGEIAGTISEPDAEAWAPGTWRYADLCLETTGGFDRKKIVPCTPGGTDEIWEACVLNSRTAWGTAKWSMSEELKKRALLFIGGEGEINLEAEYSGEKAVCVLFPFWLAALDFGDRVWHYAVNGCTGEARGRIFRPFSAGSEAISIFMKLFLALVVFMLILSAIMILEALA